MFGLSLFNYTDTEIVAKPEMIIEETVEVGTEVKETVKKEELKEEEIQINISNQISDELKAMGFKFSVDGYEEISNDSTLILFRHSVNKDAIKDIGSISVRMNWELEDGRTGGWEKNVYTKVNSVSYEEQSKTTFPILAEITDISELNNARLHFIIR